MDAYSIIKNDINSFIRTWLKTGIIVNPQTGSDFFSSPTCIKSKHEFFQNEKEFVSNFAKTYESNKYFCALSDGSCFQISYSFEKKSKSKIYLSNASLCYLPCVTEGEFKNDYVRFDYDTCNPNFFHPSAHLHIGFKGKVRLPTNEVMLFSEFFKLIMYLYYPDWFLTINRVEKVKNTMDNTKEGKLTKFLPISKELQKFIFMDIHNINEKTMQ